VLNKSIDDIDDIVLMSMLTVSELTTEKMEMDRENTNSNPRFY